MTFGSLFAGIGGLDLGLERAGFTCRWQIEIEPFCLKVLEKHWPGVKRYGDIRQLTGSELEPVDLICGGYPCQPFSQAGKRGGETDARHLWPQMLRLVRVLRPRYVLVENVPGHLSLGFGTVLGDLAGCGYDAEWCCLRASDFGASHLRKRVFIVAHRIDGRSQVRRSTRPEPVWNASHEDLGPEASQSSDDMAHRPPGGRGELRQSSGSGGQPDGGGEDLADPSRDGERGPDGEEGRSGRRGVCATGEQLADPSDGLIQEPGRGSQGRAGLGPTGADVPTFAPGPSDPRWPAILRDRPDLAPALESPLRGVAPRISSRLDGAMSNRTKRLKALGNAVVPACAQYIAERILEIDRR